jgi:hypothetical protein
MVGLEAGSERPCPVSLSERAARFDDTAGRRSQVDGSNLQARLRTYDATHAGLNIAAYQWIEVAGKLGDWSAAVQGLDNRRKKPGSLGSVLGPDAALDVWRMPRSQQGRVTDGLGRWWPSLGGRHRAQQMLGECMHCDSWRVANRRPLLCYVSLVIAKSISLAV